MRQGCVLSPLLFSIYINDLDREMCKTGVGLEVGGRIVVILLYDDDIVVLADTAEDLHRALDATTAWGSRWRASFNQKKSKVVVFGERKPVVRVWKLGGKSIGQVGSYKYLGLDIQMNLNWKLYTTYICTE